MITAILLAAGQSKRLKNENKLIKLFKKYIGYLITVKNLLLTIKYLINLIGYVIGYKGTINWDNSMPEGCMARYLCCEKIKCKYEFTPVIEIEQGINKTVNSYLKTR